MREDRACSGIGNRGGRPDSAQLPETGFVDAAAAATISPPRLKPRVTGPGIRIRSACPAPSS